MLANMPNFFLPPLDEGDEHAESNYEAIRRFNVLTSGGWEIGSERIFRIEWTHDGRDYATEVGQAEPYEHAPCIAILRSNAYLVCTPDRGVIRGEAILVGLNEIRKVVLFDDSPRQPGPRPAD